MKIGVLGLSGMLGSSFLQLQKNNSLRPLQGFKLDTAVDGSVRTFLKEIEFVHLPWSAFTNCIEKNIKNSVSESVEFLKKFELSAIVNAAAFTAVDLAEVEFENAMLSNAMLPKLLAQITRETNLPFVHISTDYVFAKSIEMRQMFPYDNSIGLSENHPACPKGKYAVSKYIGEVLVQECNPSAVVMRTAWLFAPHGKNFVRTIANAFLQGKNLKIVDDQYGTPSSALDVAEAVVLVLYALTSDKSTFLKPSGVFHMANAGVCSWYEFARFFLQFLKSAGQTEEQIKLEIAKRVQPCSTAEYALTAFRPPYSALNCDKIDAHFVTQRRDWRDAASQCIQEIKDL